MVKNGIYLSGDMFFKPGNKRFIEMIPHDSSFYLCSDSSLLYRGIQGDYSVILGGNWRFELIVDSMTGLCTCVQSFLEGLAVTVTSLRMPKAERKDLFFLGNKQLVAGGGCHYYPFENKAFWDEEKRILCFGDSCSNGEGVEFMPQIVAMVNNGHLSSIFMDLSEIEGEMPFVSKG